MIGSRAYSVISHLWQHGSDDLQGKLREFWFVKTSVPLSKVRYLRARYRNGARKVALCYPEKPRPFHSLYLLLHNLGYRITTNPKEKCDAVINFEDATFGRGLPLIAELQKKNNVVNARCNDISKERVDAVFSEVFGYSSLVNPLTYQGSYVRKSNLNTTHDGVILTGPTTPEKGYIYQMLINSDYHEGLCREMRIIVVGGEIILMFYRYRHEHNRFSHVWKSEGVEPHTALSEEEREKVLSFCKKFGLDYGELDVLRQDGRLYIIDANNTPAAPVPGLHVTKEEFTKFISLQSQALSEKLFSRNNKD